MADIFTSKINECLTTVTASPAIEKELSEFFKYESPYWQWNKSTGKKKYRMGWIRLYNLRTHTLYSGLLRYLFDFAKERGYTLAYDHDLLLTNDFSLVEADAFIKSLAITSLGKPLEARDYQVTAFAKAIRYKRLTMISPTSSGKSLIAYCVIRYLLQGTCKRGLLIVPTTSLVEQMFGDFGDYSAANGWDTGGLVQRIYEGHSLDVAPQTVMVISTWQSVYDMPPEWFHQFDFLIGDEAHTFSAKCVGSVAGACTKAAYRMAMTGTTHATEVNNMLMEGYFGPITKVTTTKKLMDEGHIATLSIKSLVLKHQPGVMRRIKLAGGGTSQGTFAAEMDYIVSCESRNRFIRNLALSLTGNSLLLFHYVERHGKVLHDMIQEKLGESDRKLFFVHGGTDVEDRESVRSITEKEHGAIICASFGVFSTGVNIRNLHSVIFASPTASKIRTLQSIGRGLRLGDNKTTATLYDIADDLRETPEDPPNYTLKHYAKRMILYYDEKFQVSHYVIQLKE